MRRISALRRRHLETPRDPGMPDGRGEQAAGGDVVAFRRRGLLVIATTMTVMAALAAQALRLGATPPPPARTAAGEPAIATLARPDIVDRNGRVIASDVEVYSLFVDPYLVQDHLELIEKLTRALPDLTEAELARALSDRQKRFVWIRRGLGPRTAQRVHDLGLPGLGFRTEWRRAYPAGALAGHVIGKVNVDNVGVSGLEKAIDDSGAIERAPSTVRSHQPPFRISLDLGVQHAVEAELADAMRRYEAQAAAAAVMDVATGEVVASASLPTPDPGRPAEFLDSNRLDRITSGAYELGSIFKTITIAQALDAGGLDLAALFDVREPLVAGRFTIRDTHPPDRALTVREIFLHSSNVGAGMIALRAGSDAQREFLSRLELLSGRRTEAGPVVTPLLPDTWGRAETITVSYGHGLAVAPLQFLTALSALVNGGTAIVPTFRPTSGIGAGRRVVSPGTSAAIRELYRLNVTHAAGTGRRAEAVGYRVGGKTGTAEMAGIGGYQKKAVISSFAAAFPMDAPRYALLVMLFEPKGQAETRGQITAGVNAAPTTGRIVSRIAPILGVAPRGLAPRLAAADRQPRANMAIAAPTAGPFDAPDDAQ